MIIKLLPVLLFLPLISYNNSSTQSISSDEEIGVKAAINTCNYSTSKVFCHLLYNEYKANPTKEKELELLKYLHDSILTCWYGTRWDFNGTTEQPGKGKIACGYFVTTILRDVGVKVNRVKHAQCSSEEMIKAVCPNQTIRRSSNESITSFTNKISEPGLYIVGLDFHTGFILKNNDSTYFIHANYTGNRVVEEEIDINSSVLAASKYKVIGKVI